MTKYIGAHSSIAKGYDKSLESIHNIGGNAVQIFLKSPRANKEKELDEKTAKKTYECITNNDLYLIGHCSYLLNFAREYTQDNWPIQSLINDIIKINKLGGKGVVLHIGKYLDMSKEEALKNIHTNLSQVLNNTPKETPILFENTAGQGTEIGFKFEELKQIYDQFSQEHKNRIKFCLDTAHAFSAGYDISNPQYNIFDEFDNIVGIENLECVHFNDSKKELNSRVDRHEDLCYGLIGVEGLKNTAIKANQRKIPLILETTEKNTSYEEQIKTIKDWINNK